MFVTMLIFLVLLFCLFSVGSLVLEIFKFNFGPFRQSAAILTGTVAFAFIGEWCAYFSLKFLSYLFIVSLLFTLGVLTIFHKKRLTAWRESFQIFGPKGNRSWQPITIPLSLSLLYMTLTQGGWSSGKISYRTGPDSFGWSDAINFFRDNLTLPELKRLIVPSLEGTPLYSSLNVVHPVGSTAIYQIPSFTRQIDAEFLLGAHRTGINYFLGNLAHLLPKNISEVCLIAFLMTSIFTLTQIAFIFCRLNHQPSWIGFLASFSVGLNCNLLFQTLEGGVGELFALTFIIFILVILLNRPIELKNLSFALGLLVVIAISSYFDIIFTAIPIVGGLILYQALVKKEYRFLELFRNSPLWIMLILSFIPFASSFSRLAITPFLHPSAGGWDIGRRPLLTNLFALISSLPPHSASRSLFALVVEGLISILITSYFILKRKGSVRIIFSLTLLMFLYLFYSVYHQKFLPVDLQPTPYNNYRLWKYSAIVSAIFPFLLVEGRMAASKFQKRKSNLKVVAKDAKTRGLTSIINRYDNALIGATLTVITITSLLWMVDWQQTKKTSFSQEEVNFVSQNASKYDFVIDGSIYSAMVTMYGDIHFGSIQRGPAGIQTHYSTPLRPILFLTNSNCLKSNAKCLPPLYSYPGKLVLGNWTQFPDFTAVTTRFTRKPL